MFIEQFNHKNLARRLMPDVLEKRLDILEKRADSSACSHFYLAPTMGQTVNSLNPLTITWNSTCLSVQAIDVYLYAAGAALPRIHVWEGIALSRGTYNATLMPRWWNSTASQSLQVSIVPAGQPPFLSQLPGGPVFTATYTPPASGTPPSANTAIVSSGITQVNDSANAKKTVTPGKKAAAVIFTLLFFALCIAAYIKIKRNRGKDKRRRWTEAVDKRMSTISTDWKSVSAAGANAAIRNSIAVGSRSSSFSFGAIRPSSIFAVEGGGETENEKRSMSQMTTGVGLRNPVTTPVTTERISRVSFAPDTRVSRSSVDSRPSGESRRTRAFHTGHVPPVPALPADDCDSGSLSPRQSQGPLTLTPDDIRARIASQKRSPSTTPSETSEIDEVMPALRMMRSGSNPSSPDEFLLKIPEPPEPAYPASQHTQHTASPIMSSMPMEPMPANVMSPDEMLRAYAERKKSICVTPSPRSSVISYPKSIVKKLSMKAKHKRTSSKTMRVLYDATGPDRHSGAPSEVTISEENHEVNNMVSMGAGTGVDCASAYPFGHYANASPELNAYGGYVVGGDEEDAVRDTGAGTFYVAHAS